MSILEGFHCNKWLDPPSPPVTHRKHVDERIQNDSDDLGILDNQKVAQRFHHPGLDSIHDLAEGEVEYYEWHNRNMSRAISL